LEDLFSKPNRYLIISEFLMNLTNLSEYIQQKCQDTVLRHDDVLGRFTTQRLDALNNIAVPPAGQDALLCIDNFNGWLTFSSCGPSC
jgi:hypothetical protein